MIYKVSTVKFKLLFVIILILSDKKEYKYYCYKIYSIPSSRGIMKLTYFKKSREFSLKNVSFFKLWAQVQSENIQEM